MFNVELITDFLLQDYYGGAEMVDHNISTFLGIPIVRSKEVKEIYPNKFYILTNSLHLPKNHLADLMKHHNYIIIEHDYKMHYTRQPNLYPDNKFPRDELVNLDYYKNAKKIFLQSNDHLECFIANGIDANYELLPCSIWSNDELSKLAHIAESNPKKMPHMAIIENNIAAKGRDLAENWCIELGLQYRVIPSCDQDTFYNALAKFSALVYFPRVKESFCRLVIEAKLLGLNVITKRHYGVTREQWYPTLFGPQLNQFLKEGTRKGLERIKSAIK